MSVDKNDIVELHKKIDKLTEITLENKVDNKHILSTQEDQEKRIRSLSKLHSFLHGIWATLVTIYYILTKGS